MHSFVDLFLNLRIALLFDGGSITNGSKRIATTTMMSDEFEHNGLTYNTLSSVLLVKEKYTPSAGHRYG